MYAKVHSHQSWRLRVTDSYRQRANNCEQTVKNFVTLTKHIQDIMHKNVTWPKLVPSTFWFKTRHSRSKGVNQGSDIKRSTTSSLKKMDLSIPISSVVAYCPIKTVRSIWCAVTSMDPSNYLRTQKILVIPVVSRTLIACVLTSGVYLLRVNIKFTVHLQYAHRSSLCSVLFHWLSFAFG